MIPTTILITNTVSKVVSEKDFKSKIKAKKYIDAMNHYNKVHSMTNEYYMYK
ncbi:hypothetical protein [Flavobacterium sp. FlaQc-50]|uniref:hypothetical protein n=1 Tax=unclassified Flavobacterium TaxID=196869 RepID=UPI00375633A8